MLKKGICFLVMFLVLSLIFLSSCEPAYSYTEMDLLTIGYGNEELSVEKHFSSINSSWVIDKENGITVFFKSEEAKTVFPIESINFYQVEKMRVKYSPGSINCRIVNENNYIVRFEKEHETYEYLAGFKD